MTTLAEITQAILDSLQTDLEDIPQTLCTLYANDALDRIIGLRNNWPHLYAEGTLAMVADDNIYTLASASFTPQTFTTIESVWDDADYGVSLNEINHQEANARWIGSNQTTTNHPLWFSVYNGSLYLWPKPSGTRTLRIGGYRDYTSMVATSDTADLPATFDRAITFGAVSLAHAQSEDYEGASYWAQQANISTNIALRSQFTRNVHRPIIMHGRATVFRRSYSDWVRGMVP